MRLILPALLCCLVPIGALAPLAYGQQPQAKPPEKVLTVDAAAASRPSLKYTLLPEVREITPGDAVPLYYRAMLAENLTHRRREKIDEDLERWQATPLDKLPKAELDWLRSHRSLELCDRAARLERCDWDLLERIQQGGFSTTLEEVHLFREFERLLMLRARLEMAEGRTDAALRTLATGLTLSRRVGNGPILISSLLGISCATLTLNEVEEFIQLPGAPNLYWTLTALPTPLIELHRGLEGEQAAMEATIPEMKIVDRPFTPSEVARLLERVMMMVGSLDKSVADQPALAQKAAAIVLAEGYAIDGRKRLETAGFSGEVVKTMPAVQVVLLDWSLQYQELFDEQKRLTYLPYWHAHPRLRALDRDKRAKSILVFGALLPATTRVSFVAARLERQVAALRTIEALRLYAAEQGRFPAKLADMIETPIPLDPVTGNAFEYALEGDKAVLRAPPPAGDEYQTGNALHYVLVLRKKN